MKLHKPYAVMCIQTGQVSRRFWTLKGAEENAWGLNFRAKAYAYRVRFEVVRSSDAPAHCDACAEGAARKGRH